MEKEKNKNAVEALKNYTGYVLYLKKILSNWPMCFIIKNTIKAKWCSGRQGLQASLVSCKRMLKSVFYRKRC